MQPHLLIIDDDENNLDVLAHLLRSMSISYTLIKDPSTAFTAIEQLSHLDAVIVDLEMPKMNGYEMLTQLRHMLGRDVPIICSTVHLTEIDTARRLGFDSFIGKPLDADRFPALLERVLNGEAVWELP